MATDKNNSKIDESFGQMFLENPDERLRHQYGYKEWFLKSLLNKYSFFLPYNKIKADSEKLNCNDQSNHLL